MERYARANLRLEASARHYCGSALISIHLGDCKHSSGTAPRRWTFASKSIANRCYYLINCVRGERTHIIHLPYQAHHAVRCLRAHYSYPPPIQDIYRTNPSLFNEYPAAVASVPLSNKFLDDDPTYTVFV